MRAALVVALSLAVAGCGEEAPDDRSLLEARGFRDVTIVSREGGVIVFEATKDGARCTGEARFTAGGDARIASRCEGAESIDELERACRSGEVERCADAAAVVRSTHPIDWPRATESSRYACEHGLEQECLHVGLAHELGERGVAQDPEAARAMYERACAAGSPPACTRRDALR